MNFLVVYVGKDLKYFEKLRSHFEQEYPELDAQFAEMSDLDTRGAKDTFLDLYEMEPKIIYVDFSTDESDAFSLCKFLNKNNETRLISTVGLFPYRDKLHLIKRALNVEVRLCHFKSLEIEDVIYHPISLINVNMAHKRTFTRCKEFDDIEIHQPVRVGYIEDNYFHIETNSYLNVGDIIEINTHPLIEVMASRKLYVAKFYDQDLYFNKRFAYDLEFIYIDNDYFVATNKRWLLYKELKKHPEKMEELDKHTRKELIDDMKKRKQAYRPIKNEIDLWLSVRSHAQVPKKLKIMVIDHTLKFMRKVETPLENFPYSLNVQSTLTKDFYQVKRSMPHLIVYSYDEVYNTEAVLHKLIEKINSIHRYNPYILVFDYENKELAKQYPENNILIYPGFVYLTEVRKIAKLLDNKLHITNAQNKVFPSSHSEDSLITVKRNVHVKTMTESIVYFESDIEIPMWTTFLVEQPVSMLLTVIPHKEDSEFKKNPKIYRSLINGVGMKEKAKLRKLINNALGMTR